MSCGCGVKPEELEDLARGAAAEPQAARLRAHLRTCPECRAQSELIAGFVGALSRAFGALESDALRFTHVTASGPVPIAVEREASGWRATLGGQALEPVFVHVAAANEAALRAFARMFPEHRCTAACSAEPRTFAAGSVRS